MQPLYTPENAVPPAAVRIEHLNVEPLPGARRVRVRIDITPFTQPPNLRIDIMDPDGQNISSVHIVETINHRMLFTMHVRSNPVNGMYTLTAVIYYPQIDPVDQRSAQFQLQAGPGEDDQ
jgi:hypothetical protein